MKIVDVIAREILDSRGNPTIEVDVVLENGVLGRFSVPSGASVGSKESLELRDGGDRYFGNGVKNAVNNVNFVIKDLIVGMDVFEQENIDKKMIIFDGTDNKRKLGANAILGVSGAVLRASSLAKKLPLYKCFKEEKSFPFLMVNILNGGKHADNNIAFQEFMIVPMIGNISEKIRISSEIFHSLKKLLAFRGFSTTVGDEGGFAPNLRDNYEALDFIVEAINESGYSCEDVKIALDVAASEIYDKGFYYFDGRKYSSEEFIKYYCDLIERYPIVSIEDPVNEDDFEFFSLLTEKIGNKVMLVGDDLFVTNKGYLQTGIDMRAGNAILIKPNQIGTITEMLETIKLARENSYKIIISHRSGETEDTTIADLAVGLSLDFIKTGSMSRGERICKYNQLLRIEEDFK